MMEKLSASEFDSNYENVLKRINAAAKKAGVNSDGIILLAATKTVDFETVNYAIGKGIKYIGENRVQEMLSKDDKITDCHRHFIGHLQRNKVKDIINRVEMIESVDSVRLAEEISKQAANIGKTMEILIEVNIGGEAAKSGFAPDDTENAVREISALTNISVKGLMTVPPICESEAEIRKYFRKMYKLFIDIRDKKIDNSSMDILSMGMSDDFDIAISEGANLVRLGTALFGKRIYI